MNVLIAFERSGVMRRAFLARGYDTVSCDLVPADDGESDRHIIGDAYEIVQSPKWDLIIAHPPCTYLCNSGVRWLHERPGRWELMERDAERFRSLLRAGRGRFLAAENPVMHGHARNIVGRGPDFTCQPWQFGDNERKRTCFWLRGLPTLRPTSDLDGSTAGNRIHFASPGKDRARARSETFPGIADAAADQWGSYVRART